MKMIILLFIFHSLIRRSQALVNCNGNVTKLQLCSFVPEYDNGNTDWTSTGKPMKVWSSVTIFRIAELDEDQNTITLNVLLSVWWYDSRIQIESQHPNK